MVYVRYVVIIFAAVNLTKHLNFNRLKYLILNYIKDEKILFVLDCVISYFGYSEKDDGGGCVSIDGGDRKWK